jgi:hypothetical protein
MIEQKTIEIMNEAIAIYSGWELKTIEGIQGKLFVKQSDVCYGYQLNYHSDWDLLMRVWDKIRTALFQAMPVSGVNDGFDKYCDGWKTACVNSDIINAHKVVYGAIQWLNKQQQQVNYCKECGSKQVAREGSICSVCEYHRNK